jgi:hypothetical protein
LFLLLRRVRARGPNERERPVRINVLIVVVLPEIVALRMAVEKCIPGSLDERVLLEARREVGVHAIGFQDELPHIFSGVLAIEIDALEQILEIGHPVIVREAFDGGGPASRRLAEFGHDQTAGFQVPGKMRTEAVATEFLLG